MKFLLSIILVVLSACTSYDRTDNVTVDSKLRFKAGVYKEDVWSSDLVFNRVSLERQGSLIYDVNYVFVYGQGGTNLASMTNISFNIYCGASSACYDTKIKHVGGNIYATSTNALYGADITNVTNVCCMF